ncbi:umuC protein [Planctomycetales bacterium]|nr:umuC protein [Planctomycetales bacterium]
MNVFPLRIFGLLDCNSFFASCEKLFRPDLAKKPVVVLSNNDGVVVARSAEAKQLGIPMGEAYFKIKRLAENGVLNVFSSNFRLYGEMSRRVMQMLYRWTPSVEVYSIDEAFVDFSGQGWNHQTINPLLNEIVKEVKRWTGIPVSLGIGTTMTLAKIANDLAKKDGVCNLGVCNLIDSDLRREKLAQLEIGGVWGIGRRLAPKMVRLGIRTAFDLASLDPVWVRHQFSVMQEQLVRELNGEQCLNIGTVPAARKSIQVSRSFHDGVDYYQTLSEAVSTFAAKACEKARADGTVASGIYVHLNTSRFRDSYLSDGLAKGFDVPTAHTPTVIRSAQELLKQIFRQDQLYKKASVILLELKDAEALKSQGLLFEFDDKLPEERDREGRLMNSVDQINRLMGKGKLFFGSQGTNLNWRGASDHCSPGYTTYWSDLPVAKAK